MYPFPVSVLHLHCHFVPILLTILTSDIVSVPLGLTISNPLYPWIVPNVHNVHTLKADRLGKKARTHQSMFLHISQFQPRRSMWILIFLPVLVWVLSQVLWLL